MVKVRMEQQKIIKAEGIERGKHHACKWCGQMVPEGESLGENLLCSPGCERNWNSVHVLEDLPTVFGKGAGLRR